MRFRLPEAHKSETSSVTGSEANSETSLERIHTFNLKAGPESNKSSVVSQKHGSSPSSPSEKSVGSLDELPSRKFQNFRTLLSLKVAAADQKAQQIS